MGLRFNLRIIAVVICFGSPSSFAANQFRMAITVDDLPTHGRLPAGISRLDVANSMIATLKSFRVPEAYGFINAGRSDEDTDLTGVMRLWVKAGYPLGNHTFTHANLSKVDADTFIREIQLNEPALTKLNDNKDWHYFRYPYLHEGKDLKTRNAVRSYLKDRGYKIAEVTDDFEDWAWNDPYARCKAKGDQKAINILKASYLRSARERFLQDDIISRFVFKRDVPKILLLHMGAFDAEMLPSLLRMYQGHGVTFIPLSEAIRDVAYTTDPGIAVGDGGDFQYNVLKSKGQTKANAGVNHPWKYPGEELEKTCAD